MDVVAADLSPTSNYYISVFLDVAHLLSSIYKNTPDFHINIRNSFSSNVKF